MQRLYWWLVFLFAALVVFASVGLVETSVLADAGPRCDGTDLPEHPTNDTRFAYYPAECRQ